MIEKRIILVLVSMACMSSVQSFVPSWRLPFVVRGQSSTTIFAKKKKIASSGALDILDELDAQLENEPLSKKEQMELEKQKQKESKQEGSKIPRPSKKEEVLLNALDTEGNNGNSNTERKTTEDDQPKLSKKDQMLQKALELEALESARDSVDESAEQTLSKKELKALKKKEEKEATKLAEKQEKKKQKQAEMETSEGMVDDPVAKTDDSKKEEFGEEHEGRTTLEDKIRRERPPPRIRVMESSQPDFISLRLENVGITFRNQEVLKDVTWGVQNGDRIGLVGKNGAGKTTQVRILAGELEPTYGDVVKSSKDLRVAVLRQEFVDELVPGSTLKEELLSVFKVENAILEEIKETEAAL